MKLTFFKIILGIFALIVVVAVGIIMILIATDNSISAKYGQVTNISDTAMTITWVSEQPYIGSIYYTNHPNWTPILSQVNAIRAWDDRDVELDSEGNYVQVLGGATPRYTHHVTLRNLEPDTEYLFRVAGEINGKELEIKSARTLPVIEDLRTPDSAYGQIENVNANDSFILLEFSPAAETLEPIRVSKTLAANTDLDLATYSFDFSGDFKFDSRIDGYQNYQLTSARQLQAFVINEGNYSELFNFNQDTYKPLPNLNFVKANATDSSSEIEASRITPIVQAQAAVLDLPRREVCLNLSPDQTDLIEQCWPGCEGFQNANKSDNLIYCRAIKKLGKIGGCYSPPGEVPSTANQNCNRMVNVTGLVGPSRFPNPEGELSANPVNPGSQIIPPAPNPLPTDENAGESIINQQNNDLDGAETILPNMSRTNNPNTAQDSSLQTPPSVLSVPVSNLNLPSDDIAYQNFFNESWELAYKSVESEHLLNNTEAISNAYSSLPLGKVSGDKILFSTSLKRYWNGSVARDRDSRFIPCLIYHELLHRAQRSCSPLAKLPDIGVRELAAEYGAVKFCASVPEAYHEGDYKFDVYYQRGELLIASARAAEAASMLQDQFNSLSPNLVDFNYLDLVNCKKSAVENFERNRVEITAALNQLGPIVVEARIDISEPAPKPVNVLGITEEDETTTNLTESGTYSFFVDGQLASTEEVVVGESANSVQVRLFVDENQNNEFDLGERVLDSADVGVEKVTEIASYNLNAGWNSFGVPGLLAGSQQFFTASDLINEAAHQGVELARVASFANGQFKIFTGSEVGENFTITPTTGLFVFSADSEQFNLGYEAVADPYPLIFNNGWNLFSLAGITNQKTANSLISEFSDADVSADTISDFNNGIYNSLVIADQTVFGNDFNVLTSKSYFLRVSEAPEEIINVQP